MIPELDLGALALLRVVARVGSVNRAAEELGLTAGVANARLRNLENQLGVTLLDRGPIGSVPNDVGGLVIEWADEVLDAATRLLAGVDALSASTRRIRIAASHTVAEHLLPSWLAGFRQRYPDVTAELHVAKSSEVIAKVTAEEVLVGFIEGGSAPRHLASLVVAQDDLVVVVDPSHPWADGNPRCAADLSTQPLVVRERDSATREVLDRALKQAGINMEQPLVELTSSSQVRNAVIGGQAPAVLSRLAVSKELRTGRMTEVPIRDLQLDRQLRAVWVRRRGQPEVVTDLLDQIVRERRAGPSPVAPLMAD